MNVFVIILLVIAGLFVMVIIIGLLAKKEYHLEKQVTINKSRQEVFNYLKLIRNQEQYSVWVMRDPHVKMVYTGTDGTVGFTSAWESNDKNVGVGEQEIKNIKDGESMEVEIRFKKPFEGTSNVRTTVTDIGDNQTRVSNIFYGKSKFPMNLTHMFMDKMVGRDMQKNLDNMKTNLEN
jgi:uncharacterized protein YndB with AHSA1/START domain